MDDAYLYAISCFSSVAALRGVGKNDFLDWKSE